jgi:ketosteroid isomerase-like protein
MTDDQDLPMDEYRRAGLEITSGNPEVYKSLWSRRDDVTLANPFGPPVRGWQEVSGRLDLAASKYRDGRDFESENIATVIASELAYTVEIERFRARVGGADELASIAVRATTVFRREDGDWKVTHRHGDPITSMRPAESVLQSQ